MEKTHLFKKGVDRAMSKNPRWKGGRHRTPDGYIWIMSKAHPLASKTGYVPEHRLVVEKHLGRFLKKDEWVHHRNAIKDDNRLENLEVVLPTAHKGEVCCPFCDRKFSVK